MKRYETGTSKDVTELLLCPSSTAGTVAARRVRTRFASQTHSAQRLALLFPLGTTGSLALLHLILSLGKGKQ